MLIWGNGMTEISWMPIVGRRQRCLAVVIAAASLLMGSALMGCTADNVTSSAPQPTPESSPSPNSGQILPIEAATTIGDRTFDIEIARSVQQQRLGLMFRASLPEDRGMLFPFTPPRPTRFWMHNVTFPLDIIFMYEGEVIYIAESVPGCSDLPENCPTYGPANSQLVDSVLELNGGTAAEIGLAVGDEVAVDYLN